MQQNYFTEKHSLIQLFKVMQHFMKHEVLDLLGVEWGTKHTPLHSDNSKFYLKIIILQMLITYLVPKDGIIIYFSYHSFEIKSFPRIRAFYLSRLVVGSSRAIIPQFSANVSARASLMIKEARTFWPAEHLVPGIGISQLI